MTLFNRTIRFQQYPRNVKLAIGFLVLGWVLHLVFYFKYLVGDALTRNDYLMVAVGCGIVYAIAAINVWAKSLCIFFNIGFIALYLFLLLFHKVTLDIRLFHAAVVIVFVLSTYFLLNKETSQYFKTYNRPPDAQQSK